MDRGQTGAVQHLQTVGIQQLARASHFEGAPAQDRVTVYGCEKPAFRDGRNLGTKALQRGQRDQMGALMAVVVHNITLYQLGVRNWKSGALAFALGESLEAAQQRAAPISCLPKRDH